VRVGNRPLSVSVATESESEERRRRRGEISVFYLRACRNTLLACINMQRRSKESRLASVRTSSLSIITALDKAALLKKRNRVYLLFKQVFY
jgi:hypothetical protein